MFSFAFDIDSSELDDELDLPTESLSHLSLEQEQQQQPSTSALPHKQVHLASLLATLPPLVSYTPVVVPLTSSASSSTSTTLLRRDLFDARFQVLNQDDEDEEGEGIAEGEGKGKQRETFVDEGTDLVKGVYEGGLKTWECSLDLVDCLEGMGFGAASEGEEELVRGKSVLELGCGTALPTCSVFARLLAEIERAPYDPEDDKATPPKVTRIHLQDYNKQVLSLITLPNLLLTYAQHLASSSSGPSIALSLKAAPAPTPDADEDVTTITPPPTEPHDPWSQPGELEVTPEFLASFEALLARERIELTFFEGDWSGMRETVDVEGKGYELVLTSETIYELGSLEALLDVLQAASGKGKGSKCLVACKRIYFGVGGGELEFRRRVEERGGKVSTVWGQGEGTGRSRGVGRVVMSVEWA